MNPPRVSVVVVSRRRPQHLSLCLMGLRQLYYPRFEIVVVADTASAAGLSAADDLKVLRFDEANIAKARNAGVAAAAGDIVAFIDDDAVPEPTWLDRLTAPFAEEGVAAAGGYVIGRNGISLQWTALSLDEAGWTHPVAIDGEAPLVLGVDEGMRAIRTQGTNMAFRRDALVELGGFDPAFHFFHDESDLNMRIARAGLLTAIVPLARVHHGMAASARRRGDRTPLSLFDVGAGSAVFHRKHLPPGAWAGAREDLIAAQTRRAERLLIDGRVEPKAFEHLVRSLHDGYAEGLSRESGAHQTIDEPAEEFRAVTPGRREHRTLACRYHRRRGFRERAAELAGQGFVVSLLVLDPTTRFHHHRFTPGGYWEQSGGLFGKSERSQPIVRMSGFAARSEAELQRISRIRSP